MDESDGAHKRLRRDRVLKRLRELEQVPPAVVNHLAQGADLPDGDFAFGAVDPVDPDDGLLDIGRNGSV